VLAAPELGGVHFTGSTDTFNALWKTIADNIARYPQYPRVVGETGGKDFVLVHPSAQIDEVAVGLLRGAFEYQGQKCSAASRAYVPRSLWPALRSKLVGMLEEVKVGDVSDFKNFMGAVIEEARAAGGRIVRDPKYRTMCEELFGPILTVFVYDDAKWKDTLALVDGTSPYALTGGVFAHDRNAVAEATAALRWSAGNFYINDKPTGAVVGQQPFGGARASGTNDKAGSMWNLIRWLSPRTIKENFAPPRSWRYPFMDG
jgi:1-pyrroline-5-carboxylate dehydrogenase